ncbi:MAG TPA: hypothetical protein V6C52_02340 [Coleofasciculaceae cyanobacterium]|jgi:Flp pilus assembly pilin Flp
MIGKVQQQHSGQGLTEYSLIAGVLVLVAVGGMLLLGQNLNDIFGNMLSSSAGTVNASGTQTIAAAPSPPVAGTQSLSITLSSGQQVQLSNYPADLTNSIQTNGANGTTELLLANMDSVIQQLQATANLTPAQADILLQLSNQGHEMANVEKLLEGALADANGDASVFNQTSFTYQGLDYSNPWDLSVLIGYHPGWGGDEELAVNFRALYDQAVSQGTLNDPVAQQTVSVLVNQIANIANGVESAVYGMYWNQGSISNFSENVISTLGERDASLGINTQTSLADLSFSTITDQDSAGICAVGKGTDSGTNCTATAP